MSNSKYSVSFEVEDKGYTLLEPGEYPFKVVDVTFDNYNGSAKIPACPSAKVELEVDGGKQGKVTLFNNFYLCQECAGLLAAFAKSIGTMKDGDTTVNLDFEQIDGMNGIVKVDHREYNGNKYNNVKSFVKKVQAKKNYGMF